jgi:hypothetical protein
MRSPLRSLALPIVISVAVAACAGSASTTQPSPAVSGVAIGVDSAAAAAARVLAAYPQFAAIGPLNKDVIGQCCWFEATPQKVGYRVTIHVGWGDCPSGCIEKHEWVYDVAAADGSISLVSETGPPVPADVPGAGGGSGGSGTTGITGKAVAGPVCPVVRANDPNCNPRPVADTLIVVRTVGGVEVARVRTDAGGLFHIALQPGSYTVGGEQTGGFPTPPAPIAVTVVADNQTNIDLLFDTGIR